jgi:ribonuclease HII
MIFPTYNTEQSLKPQYRFIAGIDEAGRGPLAGPVVACASVLDWDKFSALPETEKKLIRDSKQLSAKQRDIAYEIITQNSIYGIGEVDNLMIDEINILNATFLAMRIAVDNLKIQPDFILVDGNMIIPKIQIPQKKIIDGDKHSLSIAGASIIAKVTRDRIMQKFHQQYPEYCFDKHSGYGTEKHFAMIGKLGPSPIHRLSFSPFTKKIIRPESKSEPINRQMQNLIDSLNMN